VSLLKKEKRKEAKQQCAGGAIISRSLNYSGMIFFPKYAGRTNYLG
jgi:hypothetical protein